MPYRLSRLIDVAARLGIADLLKDGARSCDELASRTGVHPRALHRVLRALASHFCGDRGRRLRTDAACRATADRGTWLASRIGCHAGRGIQMAGLGRATLQDTARMGLRRV